MNLPQDPDILLSTINMLLRDKYGTLEELCEGEDMELSELEARLSGCTYNPTYNRFI